MSSETFTTGGQPGQVIGFITPIHMHIPINVFHAHIPSDNNWQMPKYAGPTMFEGSSLALIMVEQTILQLSLASIEMFYGTKKNFEAWMQATKNVAQISGQYTIHIAFSRLLGSPSLTANSSKTMSPNLIWPDLKKELSMQYSITP